MMSERSRKCDAVSPPRSKSQTRAGDERAGQLEQWKQSGAISEAQFDAIAALVRRERFSVFVELNTLFYLGVVVVRGGRRLDDRRVAGRLGDTAILLSLTRGGVLVALLLFLPRAPPIRA